jgi:hypothetical protein
LKPFPRILNRAPLADADGDAKAQVVCFDALGHWLEND